MIAFHFKLDLVSKVIFILKNNQTETSDYHIVDMQYILLFI